MRFRHADPSPGRMPGPLALLDIEPEYMAAVMAGLAQADQGDFVEGEANEIVARAFERGRARAKDPV